MSITTLPDGSDIDVPEFGLSDRPFGVEIEYSGPHPTSIVAPALRDAGLRVTDTWSCGGWESGFDSYGELRSPPLEGAEGARQIAIVCAVLKDLDAYFGRSDGLHVHHDVKGAKPAALVCLLSNYHGSQEAIKGLLHHMRHSNAYCADLDRDRINKLGEAPTLSELNHYSHRNACSTARVVHYGTVEFRQHEGTCDAREILSWVAFGQAMLKVGEDGHSLSFEKTNDLLGALVDGGWLSQEARDALRDKARRIDDARRGVYAL